MLRVFLRQLSARLRLFLRSSAKYTPFPKRRPCKALLFSTNLTVGSVGHESGGKNMKKPLELVSLCNCVPLNIFQHDFNGGTVPLPWRHHLRWLQQLLGWCHATATAHWDPPPYFPDWWPRATNAWQIWQMHLEKKTLEKPVTIWQKVDYKML